MVKTVSNVHHMTHVISVKQTLLKFMERIHAISNVDLASTTPGTTDLNGTKILIAENAIPHAQNASGQVLRTVLSAQLATSLNLITSMISLKRDFYMNSLTLLNRKADVLLNAELVLDL